MIETAANPAFLDDGFRPRVTRVRLRGLTATHLRPPPMRRQRPPIPSRFRGFRTFDF
jgi:hypothetical protein